jgi:hypothetical protein
MVGPNGSQIDKVQICCKFQDGLSPIFIGVYSHLGNQVGVSIIGLCNRKKEEIKALLITQTQFNRLVEDKEIITSLCGK